MKCEKCGNELEPNVTFCNKCGNQVSASSTPVVEKKKKNGLKVVLIIILLIVFLGAGIGIGLLLGKNRNKCLAPEKFSETKKDDEETKEEKDKKDNNTGSGDKKHIGKVERYVDIVIPEILILFRIQHFQQC